ncbi:MAG: hypothetical protein AMJ68_02535 [Acidithiobacillales bacterium SG8_45]|jgi:hypothetical protein|nr:MAG: hypothetical protein AMJ68_02535 [Acidithiobacillales bacterium SG8_45]
MVFGLGKERRQYERKEVERKAIVSLDGHETTVLTGDISQGGAFLKRGSEPLPSEGAEIYVDIQTDVPGEEPMVARARVVRVTEEGIGIVFVD